MSKNEIYDIAIIALISGIMLLLFGSLLGEHRQKNLIESECEIFGTARIRDIELVCQPALVTPE